MARRAWVLVVLLVGLCLGGVKANATGGQKEAKPAVWLLHLPGIAGNSRIDHAFIQGLRDAGYEGPAETYDWTGDNPGIAALQARQRNDKEAQKIADQIAARARAHPGERIVLTSHSGGTGLAVWALEKLPADVKIDTLVLMSPALSPTYDLSHALEHVTGKAYAFTSPHDTFVLGAGTKVFGTIDGQKCEAAGLCGFDQPAGADAEQYKKLVTEPYEKAWMKYGNIGDHIGVMSRTFVAAVTVPLLFPDLSPLPDVAGPATRPARVAVTPAPTTRPTR